jgi:hypothetical protein
MSDACQPPARQLAVFATSAALFPGIRQIVFATAWKSINVTTTRG